ncbi:MAG: hypothetical protein H0T69_06440 [Thermoleophilaceae bacterium]|nr:hypothetical protein [Thermoleophilaceae bacterium]
MILSSRDLPTPELGELAGQILRNAESAALLGAFGLALGTLIRNQPVAIVGVLVLWLVVEPALLALAPDVGRFAPFSALSAGIQDIPSEDIEAENADLLSPGLAALAMLAWIGAVFTAGAVLLRRRDLN